MSNTELNAYVDYKLKDSGERQDFNTGSVRDTQTGKARYSLIPLSITEQLAHHYAKGAEKYAERNWQKGQPISRYYDSAQRHLIALLKEENDENHGIAFVWNAIALVWTIQQIESGKLPKELDDREEMF